MTSELSAYLHPGQIAVCPETTVLTTILGSCVSMCVWDGASGIGGMNHFVLPELGDQQTLSTRYAGPAFESLLSQLVGLGATRDRLHAKLFGGASGLCGAPPAGEVALGWRNVEAARRLLRDAAIEVVAEDVGGGKGRKLVFETDSGNAWVKQL